MQEICQKFENTVATHGTVSEGAVPLSSHVDAPSRNQHQSNRRIAMFYAKNGRFFTAARILAGEAPGGNAVKDAAR